MESFFLFVLLVLVIIILVKTSTLQNRSNNIIRNLEILLKKYEEIKTQQPVSKTEESKTADHQAYIPKPAISKPPPPQAPPVQAPAPVAAVKPTPVSKPSDPIPQKPVIQQPVVNIPKPAAPIQSKPPINLEKFIGENLINKIGIAILVLGIGFFVKYAIDQNWIDEYGRVAIGIICAAILIGVAHRIRDTYTAFSSVLIGGGIASLYLTFTIAFQMYQIIPQTPTFIIMIAITAFTVLLSVFYDRKELAVLAIIGGFGSPFMVSTGQGNYIVLFTYIIILNCGMLSLAYYKKWNLINIISYLFTLVLYSSWLLTKVNGVENAPYAGALIFASCFYGIFFLMNIIHNLKISRKFDAFDIGILLSNTALYFSAGMFILSHIRGGDFQGVFTILLAVFNMAFAFVLYKKESVDRTLVYLLIGLVLTFVSLTAPIQLEGNYITLFWASESVLLLWLAQKSGIRLIRYTSLLMLLLTMISLGMDWSQLYLHPKNDIPLNILLNKGFITGVVSIIAVFLIRKLVSKEPKNEFFAGIFDLTNSGYKYLLTITFIVLSYMVLQFELNYQLHRFMLYQSKSSPALVLGVYNMLWVFGLSLLAEKRKDLFNGQWMTSILGALMLLLYAVYYQDVIRSVRNDYLITHTPDFLIYLLHYALIVLLTLIVIPTYRFLMNHAAKEFKIILSIILVLSSIFMLSAELDNLVVMSLYTDEGNLRHIISQNHKIGWPILWGISSFALMFIGMKKKMKDLRVLSLALFLVTLLKLFIFDLGSISEGGKIAAFISLGILLLIMSFMYQKLKKLIWDDAETIPSDNK